MTITIRDDVPKETRIREIQEGLTTILPLLEDMSTELSGAAEECMEYAVDDLINVIESLSTVVDLLEA